MPRDAEDAIVHDVPRDRHVDVGIIQRIDDAIDVASREKHGGDHRAGSKKNHERDEQDPMAAHAAS